MTQPTSSNWVGSFALALTFCPLSWASEPAGAVRFREQVRPILETYCFGCHGYGAAEGNRTLDEFSSDAAMLEDVDLWLAVMKNVRAGIMPPSGEERPSEAEQQQLLNWIKLDVFGIDPKDPDPGRVTLRRLNRTEYRNTIRDLTGVNYNTTELFPADDSGYGFDNIGDVLSVSPLLLEKYLQAAEAIVREAVPTVPSVVAERRIGGRDFRSEDKSENGDRISYYTPAVVKNAFKANHDGNYQFVVELELDGNFEFDPGRCRVTLKADGEKLHETEYGWADREQRRFEVEAELKQGDRELAFELEPLVDVAERRNSMDFRIRTVLVRGPLEKKHWVEPANYRDFFPHGAAPEGDTARDVYAREVIEHFALRAYRRPANDAHLDGLVELAKATYSQPGETFETGMARAMVAVLASPRFIFRLEDMGEGPADATFPLIDEYALASRLSYFLWSTMPDAELLHLAERGKLRENLPAQLERMVKDRRSAEFVKNFAGQWLRARDVEHAVMYPLAILGMQEDFERVRQEFRALRGGRRGRGDGRRRGRRGAERRDREAAKAKENETEEEKVQRQKHDEARQRQDDERRERFEKVQREFAKFDRVRDMFTRELRIAMRRETEMSFEYVMREDRSLLELIDADYTFLNKVLAKHYGIEGVDGDEMRRVALPKESPRGGILTQGTLLVVTSNPTRTSPVKRGLFILDNVLGSPPPPPPADVPPLEKSADAITDHAPTSRELLELHRRDPLCHSCHARMDPLGLALENFNALGMYREMENDQPIDSSGELLTGETFVGIGKLKKIIKSDHRQDFYRCVAEKMLTYALGRGLEYHDEHAIDEIVERLEADGGKLSTLLSGIVSSAPFQKQRRPNKVAGTARVP